MTAAEKKFQERSANVQAKVNHLQALIEQECTPAGTANWGHVGTLGYVEEQLDEAIAFLSRTE